MMKRGGSIAALAGLLLTWPAQAMPPGATILPYGSSARQEVAVGATIGLKIQLGSHKNEPKRERVKLTLGAGPMMTFTDPSSASGYRRNDASLIGLELRPGYSTQLNFAGQPMLVDYTKLGAADKEQSEAENDGQSPEGKTGKHKQSTGDKIAWVAAVAGGVMAVLVGIWYDACGEGRCSE